jgi:uncharacterized protein (DUF1501 family)
MSHETAYSRRVFIQQGLIFTSLACTTPMFLERTARGMMLPLGSTLTSRPGVPEDRVLVVVQLGGGNDGLNTVIPCFSDEYYRARPALAVPAPGRGGNAAIQLDQHAGVGLHPNFAAFKDLIDEGVASIVQGVGYPNPNRSHFTSMDIWHTADTMAKGHGWIGRYFDNTCNGAPDTERGVAIGRTAPLAMIGRTRSPVTFESAELFRWAGSDIDPALSENYEKITRCRPAFDCDPPAHGSQLDFLTRTALDAQLSSDRIRTAVARRPLVTYPNGQLAQQLQVVAAMIREGLATRVYYVTLGGFDTHANQPGQHANLLRQLGDSLKAFHGDLKAQGNSGCVLTMVFSEFGRRVAQNASQGTDHGTAAPMFFMGDMVRTERTGVLGIHPPLNDLDQGDLRFNVDFRCLYAAVLEDWMGVSAADSQTILGARFRKANIIRR